MRVDGAPRDDYQSLEQSSAPDVHLDDYTRDERPFVARVLAQRSVHLN